jgi:hypothetical protein
MVHTLRFSLQNAVCFIMLPSLFMYYSHFTYRACQNLNVKLRCQKFNGNKAADDSIKCRGRQIPWRQVVRAIKLYTLAPTFMDP